MLSVIYAECRYAKCHGAEMGTKIFVCHVACTLKLFTVVINP
jgi:hypothetical protein